jgi:hypothetical protein
MGSVKEISRRRQVIGEEKVYPGKDQPRAHHKLKFIFEYIRYENKIASNGRRELHNSAIGYMK